MLCYVMLYEARVTNNWHVSVKVVVALIDVLQCPAVGQVCNIKLRGKGCREANQRRDRETY